jgi:hypothetical protein
MKSRTLSSIIALVLWAAGAAIGAGQAAETQKQPVKSQHAGVCHETQCMAVVEVTGCDVVVKPYFLVMVPQPDKSRPGAFVPITIKWTIKGGTFAEKGAIYWKDYGVGHVFGSPQLAKDRKTIAVTNSGARGIYHYGIRVLNDKGETCADLDPTGINDPP